MNKQAVTKSAPKSKPGKVTNKVVFMKPALKLETSPKNILEA